jgi:hypothetical protein
MTQILYAHMNKIKVKKNSAAGIGEPSLQAVGALEPVF